MPDSTVSTSLLNAEVPALAPTLRAKIKAYAKKVHEMKRFLDNRPQEWGRFQSEFNQEINGIFRDLMLFEKEQIKAEQEDKVYKLKRLFIKWFRDDFVRGEYLTRSLTKPYGYAGDFKIIDDIYLNSPQSSGFDRLYDNYFQMSTISIAVRNRKEDFKRIMREVIGAKHGKNVRILDLASGPCREIYEVLSSRELRGAKHISVHCLENDARAIEYGKILLSDDPRVTFFRENAVRLALRKKTIDKALSRKFDLVFSTGLFDYLNTAISIRLIQQLKGLLKPGGVLAISDVRDKFSNPSIYFMEWVADWSLIYRNDDDFRILFTKAGFSEEDLRFGYEQQGVMQYVIATHTSP